MPVRQRRTKRVVVVLALVGALLMGGSYYSAMRMEEEVVSSITRINKMFPLNPSAKFAVNISYERIERVPGLLRATVKLVNPTIGFGMQVDAETPWRKNVPTQPLGARWQLNGAYSLVVDYLTGEYRLESEGVEQFALEGVGMRVASVSDKTKVELAVTATSPLAFLKWDMGPDMKPDDFVRTLKQVRLNAAPARYREQGGSGADLMVHEGVTIDMTNRSTDKRYNTAFDMQSKNIEFKNKMAEFVEKFEMALNAGIRQPYSSARAGKLSNEVRATASVSRPFTPENANVALKIPTISYRSDYGYSNFAMDLTLESVEGAFTGQWTTKLGMEAAPAAAKEAGYAAELLSQMFIALQAEAAKREGKPGPTVNSGQLAQRVLVAIPTLSKLGPVTFTQDISVSGDMKKKTGSLQVRSLGLEHSRWSLLLSGTGAFKDNGPSANFSLVCKRCNYLTYDGMMQMSQAYEVMHLLDPSQPLQPMNQTTLNHMNELLGQIGTRDANGTLTFTITAPNMVDAQIGDQPLMVVAMQLAQVFSPVPEAPVTKARKAR